MELLDDKPHVFALAGYFGDLKWIDRVQVQECNDKINAD